MSHTYLYSVAEERHRTLVGTHFPSRWGRRLSWPGWLSELLRWFARPKMVTHPSIKAGTHYPCSQADGCWWHFGYPRTRSIEIGKHFCYWYHN